MGNFAVGANAWGISDRSGFRYRLREMRKEWNGLLVGPDEYEPKHPQLEPIHVRADAQALKDARPDTQNIMSETITFPIFNLTTLVYESNPSARAVVGTVTVSTS